MFNYLQQLSSKTLTMLLGFDPEESQMALPLTLPHVTYAYTKHLWAMDKKTKAYQLLSRFLSDYTNFSADGIIPEEKNRLLARYFVNFLYIHRHWILKYSLN